MVGYVVLNHEKRVQVPSGPFAGIAQLAEQWLCKSQVASSILAASSTEVRVSENRQTMYALIVDGEIEYIGHEKDVALKAAHSAVDQKISDHHRHRLPVHIDSTAAYELDVYVYEMNNDNRLDLPFQQWFDDYYAEMKEYDREQEEREWKHYLELREKFKDRPIK